MSGSCVPSLDVEAVQQPERHGGGGSGALEGRHAHRVAGVAELEAAVPDEGLVLGEVAHGEDAAVGAYVGGDGFSYVAGVEGGGALLPYRFQDIGEIGLAEIGLGGEIAGGQSAAGHEYAPQLVVLEELVGHPAERVDIVPAGGIAVPCEGEGGRYHLGKGELAQPTVRLAQTCDRARRGD